MNGLLSGKRIGFAMTGSFCTFSQVFPEAQRLADEGASLYPILSDNVWSLDTRFYTAEQVKSRLEAICGRPIWHTLPEVEPIGPKHLLDLLIVAPCTGNSLGKLAGGIIDTPVVMAAKSQLRNGGPVLLAVSTNDALAMCAKNIGALLACRNFYFVPFRQDSPEKKPASLVARFDLLFESACAALEGHQLQPMLA